MKNRTRESCTSGSVRDEDGNILIYSARTRCTRHLISRRHPKIYTIPEVTALIDKVVRQAEH